MEKTSSRIILLRNLAIAYQGFSTILFAALFFFPKILTDILKIWGVSVAGCSFFGITIALLISRNDSTLTLFFTFFSVAVSSLFNGISISALQINGK